MEVYVPYIVGSSISAFLGNMAYSYIYSQSDYGVENNNSINNSINNNINNSIKIDTNEIDTNEIDTNEIDTNEIDTNEIDTNSEVINMNDFCLIDEKLNETEVNYTIDRRHLGTTLKEKMVALQSILKKECNREYPINNTKKVRNRWMRYIDEYHKIGHNDFVIKYKKK